MSTSHLPAVPAPLMLCDGRLVGAAHGAAYPVINPATGRLIAQAPDASVEDVAAAVEAARRAFDESAWAHDVALRRHGLRQLHRALIEHGEAFRELLVAEAGVPVALTSGEQYDEPVDALRTMIDEAERDGTSLRAPVGVVAALTPWSAPLQIALARIAPALLAGNTVVLKPAADTPWVACELGRLAAEHTDLPPGVLNVAATRDVDVAIALTADSRVDLVSLTGSALTAARVEHQAEAAGTQVELEIGARESVVVPDTEDLTAAVRTAAYEVAVQAGQRCGVPTRLLVPRERYDEAVQVAADTMRALVPGDPTEAATVCGPVISAVHRDRIRRYVALAEKEGSTVVCGGGVPGGHEGGFWFEPTVVAGRDPDARSAREEILGPVLTVLVHDENEEAQGRSFEG